MLELKNISIFIEEYINMMFYYVTKNKEILDEISDIENIINNCNNDSLNLVSCPLNIFCSIAENHIKYNTKYYIDEFTKAKYIEKNYKIFSSSDYGMKQIENRNKFLNDLYNVLSDIITNKKREVDEILNSNHVSIERAYVVLDKIKDGILSSIITPSDIEFLNHIFKLSKCSDEEQMNILINIFKSNLLFQTKKQEEHTIIEEKDEVNPIMKQNIVVPSPSVLLSKEEEDYIKEIVNNLNNKFNYINRLRAIDSPLYLIAENYKESYKNIKNRKELLDGLTSELTEIIIIMSIQELIEELELWKEEYKTGLNRSLIIEEKEELFSKLKSYEKDYQTLRESIIVQYNQEEKEELILNSSPKKLVYLTTGHKGNGNVCFESGLKDIPEEYYQTLVSMLEELKNGIVYNNPEKDKAFPDIKGYRERKEFKLRIIYKLLPNDTILITFVMPKKENHSAKKIEIINNKLSLFNDEINYIKDIVSKGDQEAEMLYAINEEIHTNIINYLTKNSRTRNR